MLTRKLRKFPERLSLTLFFGALLIMASLCVYSLWTFATFERAFVDLAFKGIPMPELTTIFFNNTQGFVAFSIPWLICAVGVIVRGTAAPRELIAYSSTLAAALLTGTILFGTAMILPWLPQRITNMNARFRLNEEKRSLAFEAAEGGDAEANLRLSQHYSFTTRLCLKNGKEVC